MIAALLFALLLAGMVYWQLLKLRRRLEVLDRRLASVPVQVWNAVNLQALVPKFAQPADPSGWAASPDVLIELHRLIRERKYYQVLELGSGYSTVVIAAALCANNIGKLLSIDSDPRYGEKTRRSLALAGLAQWAEVLDCPLQEQPLDGHTVRWYDPSFLGGLEAVDLVFVDGPPADFASDIRKTALPLLWPKLVPGGVIVLDDASRPGERGFAEAWAAQHQDCDLNWLPMERGCALLTKRAG